jgi:hypothetical protein
MQTYTIRMDIVRQFAWRLRSIAVTVASGALLKEANMNDAENNRGTFPGEVRPKREANHTVP